MMSSTYEGYLNLPAGSTSGPEFWVGVGQTKKGFPFNSPENKYRVWKWDFMGFNLARENEFGTFLEKFRGSGLLGFCTIFKLLGYSPDLFKFPTGLHRYSIIVIPT